MRAPLGSVAWAEPRRGRLTFGEKLRVVGQGIKVTLRGGAPAAAASGSAPASQRRTFGPVGGLIG